MRISDWSSDVCSSDLTPSVASDQVRRRFPECQSHTRSLVPERFRGGCSFGGPAETESLSRAGPCRSNHHRRRKIWRSAKAESIRRLGGCLSRNDRSEEHTSELKSLMSI